MSDYFKSLNEDAKARYEAKLAIISLFLLKMIPISQMTASSLIWLAGLIPSMGAYLAS